MRRRQVCAFSYVVILSLCLMGVQSCSDDIKTVPAPPPPPVSPPPTFIADPGGAPPPPTTFLFIDGIDGAALDAVLQTYFSHDNWSIKSTSIPREWWISMKPNQGMIAVYPCDPSTNHKFCLDLGPHGTAAQYIEKNIKSLVVQLEKYGAKTKIKCYYSAKHDVCFDSMGQPVK